MFAHELGHAWDAAQQVDSALYARMRGLDGDAVPAWWVKEDCAETFSYTLGLHTSSGNPAPYDFNAGAPTPTVQQIAALRAARLLPR